MVEFLSSINGIWLFLIAVFLIVVAGAIHATHRHNVRQERPLKKKAKLARSASASQPTSVHRKGASKNTEIVRQSFFNTTFSVMGHVAKADGQVTPPQIALAEKVIKDMNLSTAQRASAIELFNQGKREDFQLKKSIKRFRDNCKNSGSVYEVFLEIQIQAALVDGTLAHKEQEILLLIANALDISRRKYSQIEMLVRVSLGADNHRPSATKKPGSTKSDSKTAVPRHKAASTIQDAYVILGVDESADEASVKSAYRKLMNQNHPDKLVSTGLPEELLKIASDKTLEIRNAYERIKRAKAW